jgi:hypothetical protein
MVIALIGVVGTLAAAICGSWIGGFTANRGAKQLQEQITTRERNAEDAARRTAARLLVIELTRLETLLRTVQRDACYWRASDYEMQFPTGDQALLAAKLRPDDYELLLNLIVHYRRLRATMPNGFEWTPGHKSIDMYLSTQVVSDIQSLRGTLATYAEVDPPANSDAPTDVGEWLENGRKVPNGARKNGKCDERPGEAPGSTLVTSPATNGP